MKANIMLHEKEDFIRYRVSRCEDTIREAESALENGNLFLAANRIYYSIFYIINALALKEGFKTSKHKQLFGWFNKEFVNTNKITSQFGKIYRNAFEKRMEGDYDDFVNFSEEEINTNFLEMKLFVDEIKKLLV